MPTEVVLDPGCKEMGPVPLMLFASPLNAILFAMIQISAAPPIIETPELWVKVLPLEPTKYTELPLVVIV